MSINSLPSQQASLMFETCSKITRISNNELIFSATQGPFFILNIIRVLFNVVFYYVFTLFPFKRTRLYTQLSLCRGLNISYDSTTCQTRVSGLPEKLPKYLFLSAHHNFRIPFHYIIFPAFLTNFDKVFTVTSLKFPALGIDFSSLLNHLINSIDLINVPKEKQYFDIIEKMQECIRKSESCAVIVYSTRSGSSFLGDRSMCMRQGMFAASMALQVPIMDVITCEATPTHKETDVNVRIYEPPSHQQTFFKTKEDYTEWRKSNQNHIQLYNQSVQNSYMERVEALEGSKASCGLYDSTKMCDDEEENNKALKVYNENLRCSAHKNI
jgi:hypothetical protein